jgi:2-polyprenyl-3-methyl-5-hydroxy-6-metoxy-1,4-benzoquinol methylase
MDNCNFIIREVCPVCKSEDINSLCENIFNKYPIRNYLDRFYSVQGGIEFDYLEDAKYILCECKNCGFIYQKEILSNLLMERLYEQWINPAIVFEEQKQLPISHYASCAQEVFQVLSYLKKTPSELRFFDFGMGWGKWLLVAKAFGCNVFGCELSESRIQFAESNGIKMITFDKIPDQQFDYINAVQVFEHISNPSETLIYLVQSLRIGGLIKISVPTANNILKRIKKMDWNASKDSKYSLNPVAPLEHINYFKRKTLISMAKKAGLKERTIPLRTQY